jgi:hypothetical protein
MIATALRPISGLAWRLFAIVAVAALAYFAAVPDGRERPASATGDGDTAQIAVPHPGTPGDWVYLAADLQSFAGLVCAEDSGDLATIGRQEAAGRIRRCPLGSSVLVIERRGWLRYVREESGECGWVRSAALLPEKELGT